MAAMLSLPRASFACSLCLLLICTATFAADPETLPALTGDVAPQNLAEMWAGFDPRAEPLETEILHEWEEEEVVLRIVRFRIGVFKGQQAKLVGVYGFPKNASKVPGLLQIHGGGQYADHKACLMNGKRGFATLSIAWAGRISAPGYRVSPNEVKLFWEGKTDDPAYRATTDWGKLDGYHAPGRNPKNSFPSAKAAEWTLDSVDSPRNSGWFLCALAARRALTFLEHQDEVDADKLGVYGHSMGGKLTVLTAPDPRVKAAAPSCGGISDRDNTSELFRNTLGDDVSLKEISCPIFFLSPANDFHGRIGDLPDSIDAIQSQDWRVTCSPHHNHQDTDPYEVASLLWFDQHLKDSFQTPQTPKTTLDLKTDDGTPELVIEPDASMPILAVDVFYTQHGKPAETSFDRENTLHRYWHHAATEQHDGTWNAQLPLATNRAPLWVYANVTYELNEPVSGAGYYYGIYTANSFNLSSLLKMVSAQELEAAGTRTTLKPSTLIEDFQGDWRKAWFTYRPDEWPLTTNKLYSEIYAAPEGSHLVLEVQSLERNRLVIKLDDRVAEIGLEGGKQWQRIELKPNDFQNYDEQGLADWQNIKQLKLSAAERLKPGRGDDRPARIVGGNWKGEPPKFRNLRWHTETPKR